MTGMTYTLVWPRDLFEWEAARVSALSHDALIPAIELLVAEAILDEGAMGDLRSAMKAGEENWMTTPGTEARRWLERVRADAERLIPRREPVYFAERQGLIAAGRPEDLSMLADNFVELIEDLQDHGYFPRALPRECVDEETNYQQVARQIRRATRLRVEWPLDTFELPPETTVYTLIEYFHDQAQRPRAVERIHSFSDCGPHYGRHNGESGGVVYRWRMNALLAAHGVHYRLGTMGEERGRLIRSFDSPIGDVADRQIQRRQNDPEDPVAHAIREFRNRNAGLAQKRSAIRSLSHALEPRRKEIGERLTKKDESDLFHIVNAFSIRHNREGQRDQYGDEFLDWTFWMHLATIELLDQVDARSGAIA